MILSYFWYYSVASQWLHGDFHKFATSSVQFCSRSSFWCPRPSKSCLKPVECQNSTTLSSHSTGTTQSHMVIRRKLLYLNIPPFVTWLWRKGLSVFQCFTKFSRKKLFCLLDEVYFSQGILDWVNEHNLVFLFSCLALHICNRMLPHGPLVPVCVFLFWGISSSLLRGLLRIPENESRTWLPGHNQLQGRLRKCDLLFRVLTYLAKNKYSVINYRRKRTHSGTDNQQSLLQVLAYFSVFFYQPHLVGKTLSLLIDLNK